MYKYDYYDIFKVTPKASETLIKASYKELLRIHHPDVSKSPNALNNTQIINEGYHVLTTERSKYDDWYKLNVRSSNNINSPQIIYKTSNKITKIFCYPIVQNKKILWKTTSDIDIAYDRLTEFKKKYSSKPSFIINIIKALEIFGIIMLIIWLCFYI